MGRIRNIHTNSKYLLLFIFISFVSCDKKQEMIKKFYGVWEISKLEYYEKSSTGNFSLQDIYTDAGYFLLYDQMYSIGNECQYNINNSAISVLTTGLGNSGYCLWYPVSQSQINLWNPNTSSNITINVTKKGNKMEWTFSSYDCQEIYYLHRADV